MFVFQSLYKTIDCLSIKLQNLVVFYLISFVRQHKRFAAVLFFFLVLLKLCFNFNRKFLKKNKNTKAKTPTLKLKHKYMYLPQHKTATYWLYQASIGDYEFELFYIALHIREHSDWSISNMFCFFKLFFLFAIIINL